MKPGLEKYRESRFHDVYVDSKTVYRTKGTEAEVREQSGEGDQSNLRTWMTVS